MGCCAFFQRCEPCCRRIGCSCKEHNDSSHMASIERNRSCTDVPCIGLFGAFFAFLVCYVWTTAYSEGDPDLLIRGVNYSGKICGRSEGVEDLPYAFWPDPTEIRFKVCTDDCTAATFTNYIANHIKLNGVQPAPYASKLYMSKYCIPSAEDISIAGFDSYSNQFQRHMSDVDTAMPIIGASIAISFIVAFLFVYLMKSCVGVFVYTVIAVIIAAGYFFGYVLYSTKDEASTQRQEDVREYGAYILWALTTIFTLMMLFARNRIRIAIQVIKSASRSIGDMPMMVLFPIGPIICMVLFFFAWVYAAIYIFSAGELSSNDTPNGFESVSFAAEDYAFTTNSTYEVIDYDEVIQNQFAPHFFFLLWVAQFLVYFTFTVIAGAVANWYFTKRDENENKIRGNGESELPNAAVCRSCTRTSRYHLGTIIYAALIIAIIQFIRWCVRYLERMMSANGKEPNKLQRLLFRITDCFLWCLECCLDKVSRNALIWTSIYGDPFCPAVCGSFKIIWSNLMRVAVITFFSTIVTLLGKIMIPLITTGFCASILIFLDPYKSELGSTIVPLLIIFVVSLAISMMYLTVYDTAIDAVFMCFLIDEKHNKNNGQMLADEGLREIVQKYEAQSKELALKRSKRVRAGNDHQDPVDEDISKQNDEVQI